VDSVDYIYWTFSAAAQSISAFVALLLAGYALVNTLMESAREQDDSLDEIHSALRIKFHKWLRALAAITGGAIVLSLAVAYFNRPGLPVHGAALAIVALIDVVAIVGGLAFAVAIVDPRKYQKAAARELRQGAQEAVQVQRDVSASEFFDAFLHLEKMVRDYLRKYELYIPSRGAPRMSFSFRQMIEALLQNERIDRAFFDELQDINKHRNLVFHGHVTSVDPANVERVRRATERIEGLK
jgi:predicted DNA-binding ribbon-helix-helix protein